VHAANGVGIRLSSLSRPTDTMFWASWTASVAPSSQHTIWRGRSVGSEDRSYCPVDAGDGGPVLPHSASISSRIRLTSAMVVRGLTKQKRRQGA
jgi:hypothetical protein